MERTDPASNPKEIPTFGSIKAQVDIYNQTHILSCFTMTIALGPVDVHLYVEQQTWMFRKCNVTF